MKMSDMLEYQNPWDRTKILKVAFKLNKYEYGGGLHVRMWHIHEGGFFEPWCTVTVNLVHSRPLKPNEAYVDMPNIGDSQFLDWLKMNGLIADFGGEYGYSGYCKYPLVQFNLEELKKHLYVGG